MVIIISLMVISISTVGIFNGRPALSSFNSWTQQSSNDYLAVLTHTTKEKQNKGIQCRKNQILSPKIIKSIKVFLFFIGYARSGHSIVGSVLDAHPHIVVSHELQFMNKWDFNMFDMKNAGSISTRLYKKMYKNSLGSVMPRSIRKQNSKGYSLSIKHSCQGSFDSYIDVIGDKSGGGVTTAYMSNRTIFLSHYELLKRGLNIPIKVVHVIRNPYDNIATKYLYLIGVKDYKRAKDFVRHVKENKTAIRPIVSVLKGIIARHFDMVQAVTELIKLIGRSNVLDVHQRDLVHHPRKTVVSITEFLGVKAEEDYLELCVNKIFKEVSYSRNLLVWPDELREMIEQRIKDYKFLEGYSFISD